MTDIVFNGGDEIVQPFVIDIGGASVNLTGCTVTGEVWWRGRKRLDLTVAAGIEILKLDPAEDEDHGMIRISEVQSALFPRGRIATLRFVVVTAAGVTTSTGPTHFERRL